MKKRHRYKVSIALLAGMVLMASTTLHGYGQSIPGLLTDAKMQELGLETSASEFMAQKVRLKYHQVSIEKLLKYLEQQKHVQFSYSKELLAGNPKVTVSLENVTLDEALKVIFRDTNIQYFAFKGGYVVLRENKFRFIQETVSGTVTDASTGETLPGVNIVVKGTTTGTSTDADGEYELTVESLQGTLVFSFIGYQTQEVPINNRTTIDITLMPQAISGDEMVVIGYGAVQKSDLTGSVSSLSADETNTGGTSQNIDQMLQGRVAGVQITQASAAPGGGVSVRIRGVSSINTDTEPLYVIDGMPIDNSTGSTPNSGSFDAFFGDSPASNPLNAIDPDDIASIEILKDASATAIYGSRGANGVILISTKRGRGDGLRIDYSSSIGIQRVANKIDLLNAEEYVSVMNELEVARGNPEPFPNNFINTLGGGTDWQDELLRTAPIINQGISVSGGGDNSSVYGSFKYSGQDGIIINSGLDKYSGRINYDYNKEKFSLGINFSTTYMDEDIAAVNGLGGMRTAGAMNAALNVPPIFKVYDEDGNFIRPDVGEYVIVTLDNPVALAKGNVAERVSNRTLGNINAEYDLFSNLSASIRFGADRQNDRVDAYNSRHTIQGQSFNGIAQINTSDQLNYLVEGTLNYQETFADNHSINAVAGYTFENFNDRFFGGEITNFPSDVLFTNNLGSANTENDFLNSNATVQKLMSFFGRVNYNFSSRYLITASLRSDGSSNFGKNNRFAYFPSFAFGWNPLEESFISDEGLLSNLKLRLSWGISGNDKIGANRALQTYSTTGGDAIFGSSINPAIGPARIANPDLKWETTRQVNLGLDFGLFNERLTGSIDIYDKYTSDLLLELPVPNSTGYQFITSNTGNIKNQGIEVTLESRNFSTRDFIWTSTFNFAAVENEVQSLGPISEIITGSGGSTAIIRPGMPIFSYYGLEAEGVFQEGDDIANSAQANTATPGVPKWKDVNGDGEITGDDRVNLGNPFPDYTFGIGNTFDYKGIELNIFIEGVQGNELMNWALASTYFPRDPARNGLAKPLLNRWTPTNPTNEWPSGVNPENYQSSRVNSFTVEDASFIRLKNVKLSYSIPVDRIRSLRSAQIYLNGENLAIITDYLGYDPDVNSLGRSKNQIDRNAYPRARTVSVGLNVGF